MDKIKNILWQLALVFLPILFTLIAFKKQAPIWTIGTVVSLFIMTALLPVCHKRENLWMFLFAAFFGLPINIRLSKEVTVLLFGDNSTFENIIYGMMVYFMLFSIEEITFAVITRFIWRKQYKLFPKEFDDYIDSF